MVVNLGDQIIVGTPSGPRFQLLSDQPMAAAPTAGQIVATALTLLFLPARYAAWFRERAPDDHGGGPAGAPPRAS